MQPLVRLLLQEAHGSAGPWVTTFLVQQLQAGADLLATGGPRQWLETLLLEAFQEELAGVFRRRLWLAQGSQAERPQLQIATGAHTAAGLIPEHRGAPFAFQFCTLDQPGLGEWKGQLDLRIAAALIEPSNRKNFLSQQGILIMELGSSALP